jgi:hypothetical protein
MTKIDVTRKADIRSLRLYISRTELKDIPLIKPIIINVDSEQKSMDKEARRLRGITAVIVVTNKYPPI